MSAAAPIYVSGNRRTVLIAIGAAGEGRGRHPRCLSDDTGLTLAQVRAALMGLRARYLVYVSDDGPPAGVRKLTRKGRRAFSEARQ